MIFIDPIATTVTPVTVAKGTVTCILWNYSFHRTSYVIDERSDKQDEILSMMTENKVAWVKTVVICLSL